MRTHKKAWILLVIGAVILLSAILASFIVERPKDIRNPRSREYSIATSGLPPQTRRAITTSGVVLYFCAIALNFYIEKLDRSVISEQDVARLKRFCRTYQCLLMAASIVFGAQIVFAAKTLLSVHHVGYAHLLHSKVFGNVGILFICGSLLLFSRRYIKAIHATPPSAVLASKLKLKKLKQEYDLLPEKLKKEQIASLPLTRIRPASDYQLFRNSAIGEPKPGFYTLVAMLLVALVKHDKHLADLAGELTRDNVPEDEYLYLIGSSLCYLGFQEEGYAMLRKVVELDPSASSVAMLACYAQDIEEKRSLANKVLTKDPDNSSALLTLADAKYHGNETEEAEHILNKILEIDSDAFYALEMKGNICFDRGEYREAFAFYRTIKVRPLPVSLQFQICRCYYCLGMTKKAKRIARKIENHIKSAYEIDIEGGIEAAQALLNEILSS